MFFFFSSRRRHTRWPRDWSSDVCSSDLLEDREAHDAGRYRFKHLLMRDVAYAALPKAERADLHEVFARELERSVGDRRDEYAEIVAFQVARAFTLSAEVRAPRAVLE